MEKGQALWIGSDMNFTLSNPKEADILRENLIDLTIQLQDKNALHANAKNILDYYETLDIETVGIKVPD